MAATKRKAHKIDVFRFAGGNSGKRVPIGFIWRHGEPDYFNVPVFNGAATPTMEETYALVVQIAGKKRFVTDGALAAGGPKFTMSSVRSASDIFPAWDIAGE